MQQEFVLSRHIAPPCVTTPDILRLYSIWCAEFRDLRRAVGLDGVDRSALAWCGDHLSIIQCRDGDFSYLSCSRIHRESGGALNDGNPEGSLSGYFRHHCELCFQEQGPIFASQHVKSDAFIETWERLVLPVLGDAGQVQTLLVYDRMRVPNQDMIKGLLESSHCGIVTMEPLRQSDGALVDFTITAANQLARQFFQAPIDTMVGEPLRSHFPGIEASEIFRTCAQVAETGHAQDLERSQGHHELGSVWFRVTVNKQGHGITMTLSDISALIHANHELRQEIARRKELEDELRALATTDELTGLANRRHFLDRLGEELSRATRQRRSLSLLMIDVDYFKSINDQFGHDAGDRALVLLSQALERCCRSSDLAGRVGGEEFALLLVEAKFDSGMTIAHRVHEEVEACRFEAGGQVVPLSVSCGLTVSEHGDESVHELMKKADDALYRAKRAGRNQTGHCVDAA